MGRGVIVALLLSSLAVNVFLGGFVAGRILGASPDETADAPPVPGRGAFPRDPSRLSPEARAAFRASFEANRADLRSGRRGVLAARRELAETLSADEWDRAAVEAAMEKVRIAREAQSSAQNRMLIDAFEKLSVEERKAFVAAQSERQTVSRRFLRSGRGQSGEE